MTKLIQAVFVALLIPGAAIAQGALEEAAQKLVDQLAAGEFTQATERFDETMNEAMPSEKLEAVWKQLATQVGVFSKRAGTRSETIGEHQAIFVRCEFERMALDARVVFDSTGKIAGLFFTPAQPPEESTTDPASRISSASYVDSSAFTEREVSFGNDPWALPGTLSIPRTGGPFPALVLVHGSGPNDRDETVGPNKPFRDLAQGLATRGIAVLRYDKRTRVHGKKMAGSGLTVAEEAVDDAVLAVQFLAAQSEIDSTRISLLGHSLGGYLVPRIAAAAKPQDISGYVILAGSTRPMEDLILEQMHYIADLDGSVSDQEQARLRKIQEQVAKLKSPDLKSNASSAELPLGVPASYWLDLREYNAAQSARSIEARLLILQGERDYQVTMQDFEGWKLALAGLHSVTFKSYPTLNHLFMNGSGRSQPAEYQTAGHVSPEVVADITAWILNPG